MVAITEPAMAFDGIRSLKGFRRTRKVNPGPMPNHLGGMQSTTAEPRGEVGFEFWVLGEMLTQFVISRVPAQTQNSKPKTQNSKLNLASFPTPIAKNVEIPRFANPLGDFEPGFELRKIGVPGIVFLDDGRIDRVATIKQRFVNFCTSDHENLSAIHFVQCRIELV